MLGQSLKVELSTVEAWELVGYLATSTTPELIEVSQRLEKQLNEIDTAIKLFEEAKNKAISSRRIRKPRE